MKTILDWFTNKFIEAFSVPEVTEEDVSDQLLDSIKFNREKNIEENILIPPVGTFCCGGCCKKEDNGE